MVVWAPRRLARAAYWCREFCCYASRQGARPQLFACDDRSNWPRRQRVLAASWWLAFEDTKNVEKSCLLACCKDTSKNLLRLPQGLRPLVLAP